MATGVLPPEIEMRHVISITTTAFALVVCCAATAQQPADPKLEKDIVYGKAPDGAELKLDYIRPTSGEGPFPLIILLHGGGWRMGDRKDYHQGMPGMAKLGWAAATVQYRFAPKHRYPAQIEDVRMALAFLRAHAKKYDIDADRIAVVGGSAGGHLALMLGLSPDKDGKTAPGVRAVVSFAGPTDFRSWRIDEGGEKVLRTVVPGGWAGMVGDLLGTTDRTAPVMAEASPITHVRKGNPAVLSIQGSADNLVPVQQGQALHQALKRAGVTEKLVVFDGGGHGLGGEHATKAILEMRAFLNKHVRETKLLKAATASFHAADKPIPIIFDTDIGTDVDDAYALVLAARHPNLDLRAVTTLNGKAEVRAAIARKLLHLMGKDKIPVAAGRSKPMDGHETFWGGWEGKGLLAPDEKVGPIAPQMASDLIIELLEKSPDRITIVSVGGLSNVAEVLQKAPKLKSKIKRLVIMGGSVRPVLVEGKRLPEKIETNLHNDTVAATLVLCAGIPVTLVPAEVTFKTKLLLKDYERIQKSREPLPRAMTAMTDIFAPLMKKFMKANGIDRYYDDCAAMLHDPLAVMTLAEPSVAKVERMTIRLDAGKGKIRTIRDPKGPITVDVVTDADIPRLSATVTRHVLK
jgi:inosine-uridine nucleoside N-ribohydrolase/acetyl esterase/lipase